MVTVHSVSPLPYYVTVLSCVGVYLHVCVCVLLRSYTVHVGPKREILVLYNLSLLSVVLPIIPIDSNTIVLTKLIALIWECGNIGKNKSD